MRECHIFLPEFIYKAKMVFTKREILFKESFFLIKKTLIKKINNYKSSKKLAVIHGY